LIPIGRESGILDDDYLKFLKTRGRLILDEIEHLCGISSIPSADMRHKAIEKMERRIRDFIHCTLIEATGEEYWMKVIPNDVREGAEKRIISELKKHPDRKQKYFNQIRVKLDYLNVADFVKIVANKNNWPHFESVFGRKNDLERHLEAFSEFRNSIMHNRDLTEIALKSGELSFIWLENALPPENGQENNIYNDNNHA
jgi:hypothetical protein